VEFDAKDPSSVILRYFPLMTQPVDLYYGGGIAPYVNIVDAKDIPLPAFGPVEILPAGKR
jgi:hypothetical protein